MPSRRALLLSSLFVLAACGREPAAPTAPAAESAASEAPAAAPPPAPVALSDVVETRPDYIVGISYPQAAARDPGLAALLLGYAERQRAQLMQAVQALGGQKPRAPYDLSLQFRMLADTPQVVAVAADGSMYTGGAHGTPLVERFVWLPQRHERLTSVQLFAAPGAWKVLSDASREQLLAALSRQLDDDGLEGAVRAEQQQLRSRMIAEGTRPLAEDFSRFEPVVDADGRIRALRFVFPPYQVAPYVDGTQTVEIPAATLLPLLAPAYRPLFRGG
ncbi:DUF3298 and DUF4163 domain-containing protein [Thermomonas flagellata]|uniref:DUF3298 and DUF4163 domain-containing protein n=1 Tax=Thermomonas flagellata TaxID=2888524 RepID=UPI001F03A1E2|nr:DUF3298 and DUF4163 domain-containing protein [Thermomonas flagellata]